MTKWYNTVGEAGDIVLSTGIRLVRNIEDFVFPCRLDSEGRQKVSQLVRDIVFDAFPDEFCYIETDTLTYMQRLSMAERNIISPEFAGRDDKNGLILSSDENTGIMLCEQDHIRLQTIMPGLCPEQAYEYAGKIDKAIAEKVKYAYSDSIGYLTQSPSDLGTAMRCSVMLHLPALSDMGRLPRLARSIRSLGFSIRPVYGVHSRTPGDFYSVSNRITLGIDEKTAVNNLKSITSHIAAQEHNAASLLIEDEAWQDRIFRAYGILSTARLLSYEEFMQLISIVRFGSATGVIDVPLEKTNMLIIGGQPATLSVIKGVDDTSTSRNAARAKMVREVIRER
ncbi:MAG: ATP--guanido phosphotransferase [Clostridiales bacterium]|nr:ATP--guanido phosphotransferase [Clostridiales bacterium]